MSQKLNRCLSLGVFFLMSQPYFCHRIASAVRSDCVRHSIRLRPPPDLIASGIRWLGVNFLTVGGYGILAVAIANSRCQ